jgi:hypothetical protein
MSRRTTAPQTIEFLEDSGGASWEEIARHFGISRVGVGARIRAARRFMSNEDGDKTIPRPTRGTGYLYQVTDQMYASPSETSIARSSVDDLQQITTMARRLVNDGYVAFDAIPKGKRTTKSARSIRTFIGAMENAATVCESERTTLESALSSV